MIDLKKDCTPFEVFDAVWNEGICRIESFVSEEDVKKIKEELSGAFKNAKDDGSYAFGKAIRIGGIEKQKGRPTLYRVFNSDLMKYVAKRYCSNGYARGFNADIFATHDFRADQGLARNGYVHFDRLWRFKFFLYLTDVEEGCGAFSAAPATHHRGLELRKNITSVAKDYEDIKNRIDLDYPNEEYNLEPVYGKAGTMIVFTSDVFHKGGDIEEGKERMIVRGHSW